MCGLAGILMTASRAGDIQPRLDAMLDSIRHRGPDDSGSIVLPWGDNVIALGHRRLAILDVSPLGRQPMAHTGSGCQLVFNGEIYNFQRLRRELEAAGDHFRGRGDTEVLLAGLVRYGTPFLARLEGMFALAFWDPREPCLILARDHAGIKPLYLADHGTGWAFASECRALVRCGLVSQAIDRQATAGLLAYGAVPEPLTIFEEIRALPQATSLRLEPISGGGWRMGRPVPYWDYPRVQIPQAPRDVIPRIRELVQNAVSDHLVADVPVGIFLSGGVDSTIVAAAAAKTASGICSFTVACDEHADFSEAPAAEATARELGLRHTTIPVGNDQAESSLRQWLADQDQPSVDGLNVYIISQAVRRCDIKVALCGLGADELFGGYASFRDVPRIHSLMRRAAWLPRPVRSLAAQSLSVGRTASYRQKLVDLARGSGSVRSLCLGRRRLMPDVDLQRLGLDHRQLELTPDYLPYASNSSLELEGRDLIHDVSMMESRFYQTNTLLRNADITSMAHGLELRVPFLDRRLLEGVQALPGSVRMPAGARGKYLLHAAFPDWIRPALRNQVKRGFSLPIRRWMLGPLRDWCQQRIARSGEILETSGAERIWRQFMAEPDSTAWARAFTLCVLADYLP